MFKRELSTGELVQVPCGRCIGCRIDRAEGWAIRCLHESKLYEDNCFITLTYDNEHLPYGGTLVKEHLQKFFKKLRRKFAGVRIRYYACGEYGENLQRPHYHVCLFNLTFDDLEPLAKGTNYGLYTSETLEKIWAKGFCTVGEFTFETAAYTAKYCVKKMNGEKAKAHYTVLVPDTGELIEIEPEFNVMSRGRRCPTCKKQSCSNSTRGLGAGWYEQYASDYFPSDEVIYSGKRKKPPRFYTELLKETDPEIYEKVKALRHKFASEHQHDNTWRRLAAREKCKEAKFNLNKRNLSQ